MLYDLYFPNILYIIADIVVISNNLTKQMPKFYFKTQVIKYLSSTVGGPKLINILKYSYSIWK